MSHAEREIAPGEHAGAERISIKEAHLCLKCETVGIGVRRAEDRINVGAAEIVMQVTLRRNVGGMSDSN
jgi:hypothetical protein